jgi:hypothetical protein
MTTQVSMTIPPTIPPTILPIIRQATDHILLMTMQPAILQTAENIPQMRTTLSQHRLPTSQRRLPTYPYQSTIYHPNFLGLGTEKEENTMMSPTYQNQVAE